MAEAQRIVEYEGTLVYLHGSELATLRIAHRIDNGVSKESLLALSGPIRAVARNEYGVTCMLSGTQSFSVPRARSGGALLRSAPHEFERIRQHYLLHALGQSRVAGRDTDVIGIVPLDDYRYGYRYFVDRDTGLPLKIDLMDDSAQPIEQVMFTSIEIFRPQGLPDEIPDGRTDKPPAVATMAPPTAAPRAPAAAGWRLSAMPPGFAIVARAGQPAPQSALHPAPLSAPKLADDRSATSSGGLPDRPRDAAGRAPAGNAIAANILEHLVVSDGIATVSVYVESSAEGGLDGAMRMGAITAVGAPIGARHATVVGEVPERTARMLLDGLTPPHADADSR